MFSLSHVNVRKYGTEALTDCWSLLAVEQWINSLLVQGLWMVMGVGRIYICLSPGKSCGGHCGSMG